MAAGPWQSGRVALAINEATAALWGWIDKEPFLATDDQKNAVATFIAEAAIKHV